MQHTILMATADDPAEKYAEAVLTDEQKVYLVQREYTSEELERFQEEAAKWILCRAGSRYFLADSDSGEDARGYYRGYFDLKPENAVFDQGRCVGFYLCPGDLRYSGNGRATFDLERWGYPGYDPFEYVPYRGVTHVFLFAEPDTHSWKDWTLLVRDTDKDYTSYIDF